MAVAGGVAFRFLEFSFIDAGYLKVIPFLKSLATHSVQLLCGSSVAFAGAALLSSFCEIQLGNFIQKMHVILNRKAF